MYVFMYVCMYGWMDVRRYVLACSMCSMYVCMYVFMFILRACTMLKTKSNIQCACM